MEIYLEKKVEKIETQNISMKILSILILAGFSAILLAPVATWAAACPSNQVITVACECGANSLIPGGGNYCDNGTIRPGSPSTIGGEQPPQTAPTLVTSGAGAIALIERIGNWMFAILMAVAAIFLIYGGFTWVTAGGNPENVTKARTMLINALIGVAVALLARGLVMVVKSIIGG